VFCTLSFAGQQRMDNIKINCLVIDEAAQATEAETLIPFRHCPRKCLLVGDTNQLPALVKSDVAKANNYDWSMMHRLQVEAHYPFKMLNIQHRMDSKIRAWPSRQFYQDILEDAEEISLRPMLLLPVQLSPYSFINVKGTEITTPGGSKSNKEESTLVVQSVKYLLSSGVVKPRDIGIITFYSGQVELINRGLAAEDEVEGVVAQTVDGFQGEEKDVILISFVRSNDGKSVGFLNDFRRLNVAITRARRSLIMIGDSSTLKNDETLATMVEHISQQSNLYDSVFIEREIFGLRKLPAQ